MAESLDSASGSVCPGLRSWAKVNWLLNLIDGDVDLPVLLFNTKDVTRAVFPLGCCYRLRAFADQISEVSEVFKSKVKVSHGNELIGPCYELYNL